MFPCSVTVKRLAPSSRYIANAGWDPHLFIDQAVGRHEKTSLIVLTNNALFWGLRTAVAPNRGKQGAIYLLGDL